MGRVPAITSYDAATSGNVVNQIKFTCDGWGNVIKSEKAHDGAVGAGTPAVQCCGAGAARRFGGRLISRGAAKAFIESQKKNVVFSVGAICDAREIRGFSREMAQVKGDNINLTLNSLQRKLWGQYATSKEPRRGESRSAHSRTHALLPAT